MSRSYVGKLFAIFWVLLGITLFSMLTATLTTGIITAHSPASTDMSGKDIAVLKGRIHDMSVVAHHGGMLRMGSIGHTMRGINQLITMVENRTAHGYLIDRNTYRYFNNRIKEKKYKYIAERFERLGLTMTEKSHAENHLKCGILVKERKDYEFFKGYFDNNRLVMHSCNDVRMNTRKKDESEVETHSHLFTAESRLFKKVIKYILVMVGAVVVVGVLVDIGRYYVKSNKIKYPPHTV